MWNRVQPTQMPDAGQMGGEGGSGALHQTSRNGRYPMRFDGRSRAAPRQPRVRLRRDPSPRRVRAVHTPGARARSDGGAPRVARRRALASFTGPAGRPGAGPVAHRASRCCGRALPPARLSASLSVSLLCARLRLLAAPGCDSRCRRPHPMAGDEKRGFGIGGWRDERTMRFDMVGRFVEVGWV